MKAWRWLLRIAEGVLIVLACAIFGHRARVRQYPEGGYVWCERCGIYLADLPADKTT